MRKEINNLEFNSSSFYWHNILQQLCLLDYPEQYITN